MRRLTVSILLVLAALGSPAGRMKARSFSLQSLDRETVFLDSCLKRGPVLICFWALWCKACIEELDALKKTYDEFESLGFQVLAISQDGPAALGRIKPFVRSRKWRYSVLLDPTHKVKALYGVKAMPTSFLVSRSGEIVYQQTGYRRGDERKVREKVKELLEGRKEK